MPISPLTCSNCGAPLDAEDESPGVLVCAYCGRSHRFLVAPPPAPAVHRHPVGSAVIVEWGGRWWDAHVIETPAPNVWRVSYDGWSEQWNDLVEPHRIRDRASARGLPRPAKPRTVIAIVALLLVVVAGGLAFAAMNATRRAGVPVQATPAQTGERVEVLWRGSWYSATVLERYPDGSVRVRYDGYGADQDETVRPRRVRPL